MSEVFLKGLQEELVVPGIGVAAVVYFVERSVDLGRGELLPILRNRNKINLKKNSFSYHNIFLSIVSNTLTATTFFLPKL